MNIWTTGAIAAAVALIAVAYIVHVRGGGTRMHKKAPLVIALAVLAVAVNELAVIPTYGVEAGTNALMAFFVCIILPATVYLNKTRTK